MPGIASSHQSWWRCAALAATLLLGAASLSIAQSAAGSSGDQDAQQQQPAPIGRYTPTEGFRLADTEHGTLNLRIFTYLRYLNELGTDETFTDAFGNTKDVKRRNDLEMNKAQVTLYGWILSRKFLYNMFIWSSNSTLGLNTQVIFAGTLYYRFNEHLTVGAGIGGGLPGTRSVEGSFPFWLPLDSRQIADEYFRPGYTSGFIFNGNVFKGLDYKAMWGNNLNQFGIDAGQLDDKFDTVAAALIWTPTTGEFGRGFGDFEWHDKVATRVAVHGAHSTETRQGQPNTDAFDNVQLRISDGNVIFAPNLFGPDLQIEEAVYRLFAADAGVKYKGLSFDVEYYKRRLDNFATRGGGVLPFTALNDTGVQWIASAMPIRHTLQLYAGGSKIFGEYGDPGDFRAGANWFPKQNQVIRWNAEYIHLNRSPVGSITYPYSVGGNGHVLHSAVMVYF